MKLVWIFDEASIKRIRDYVDLQKSKKFVLRRKRRNCGPTRKVPSKRKFVRHMIGALVTTQQRSGPNSRAAIFIRKEARTIAV